ncbi:MAG: peptidoglycan editing factor PgeF [Marinobacter sp.]|uniref:peptidoglycan editing factor PgeF n=1 Tax=Marinobacter sp. TaxID=50741 RepID=UPI00299DC9E5|nr:peptidoglycan editing factor PgeF [Marinobacter sp.]MDX1757281.1 peptidoglycan editing factor PgeF [Marinobacter sp.]
MTSELAVITPDWPAPAQVRAGCTTRQGGVSASMWASLNLGSHVQDNEADVQENRRRLADWSGLPPDRFYWLNQVHGTAVACVPVEGVPEADAGVTGQAGQVCTVLTADCLPVLFCDLAGSRVAAVHAGWRGLCGGVLEQTVAALGRPPEQLLAWLGPAIGPEAFEVGGEVREAFVQADAQAASAFRASPAHSGHYLADLYRLARQRLRSLGLTQIYGGEYCTVSDPTRFFSYRRDGITGRMASVIWIESGSES